VEAAALHTGAAYIKNHWSKAKVARKLSQRHSLTDVSDLLADLNEARKGTAYGDVEEPEISPEDALATVGSYVEAVEVLLKLKKEK
jgi:hypothetical protein